MTNNYFILAVIQARLNSKRFPGKVLNTINSYTLIHMIYLRISQSRHIDAIVVATSNDSSDDLLVNWLEILNIPYFRGSSDHVLDRFVSASRDFSPTYIVRITADDPFKDCCLIEQGLEIIQGQNLDYVSNTLSPTYPEGLDFEIFKFSCLQEAHTYSSLASEYEHVTPYIWKNPDRYKLFNLSNSCDLSHLRLTIDYPSDVENITRVLQYFDNNIFVSAADILHALSHGSLTLSDNNVIRNQGYYTSISLDRST